MTQRPESAACLLVVLLLAAAGCSDPTDGKPEATLGDAVRAEPAAVPRAPEGSGESGDSEAAANADVYILSSDTYIGFAGSKIGGTHYGQFISFEGNVVLQDGDLATAKIDVTIDMTSTETDDTRLTGVLKGPHFFDVAGHPKAAFVSTAISPADGSYEITGNLTIRGITKSIAFPAVLSLDGAHLEATAGFTIDRNAWGIGDGWVSDTVVKDDVLMELDVEASLKSGS